MLWSVVQGDAASDRFVEMSPTTGTISRDIGPIGSTPVLGMAMTRNGAQYASHRLSNDESELLMLDVSTGQGTVVTRIASEIFDLTAMPCQAPCFAPPVDVPVPAQFVVTEDIDRDGALDVVAATGNVQFLEATATGLSSPLGHSRSPRLRSLLPSPT